VHAVQPSFEGRFARVEDADVDGMRSTTYMSPRGLLRHGSICRMFSRVRGINRPSALLNGVRLRRDPQLNHPASWSEPILTTIGANVKGGLPFSRCLSPDGAVGYRHFAMTAIGNDGANDWAASGERDVELIFNGEGATEPAAEWIHLGGGGRLDLPSRRAHFSLHCTHCAVTINRARALTEAPGTGCACG